MNRILLLLILFSLSSCWRKDLEPSKYPPPEHIMGIPKRDILGNISCIIHKFSIHPWKIKYNPDHMVNGVLKNEFKINYRDSVKLFYPIWAENYQLYSYYFDKTNNEHYFLIVDKIGAIGVTIHKTQIGKFSLDHKNEIDSVTVLYYGTIYSNEAYLANILFEKMIFKEDATALVTGRNKEFHLENKSYLSCPALSYFDEKIPNQSEKVDESAGFPGGLNQFYRHVAANMKYPLDAQEGGIQGKVLVQFVINEQGFTEDIVVVEDIGGGCGQEAVRIIKESPPWIPAKIAGKPVKARMRLPIIFKYELGKVKEKK